jgi:heme A synthase
MGIWLLWSDLADEITPRLLNVADVLFLVLVLVVVVASLPVILASGVLPVVAIALFAAIALVVGHPLAFPDRALHRCYLFPR